MSNSLNCFFTYGSEAIKAVNSYNRIIKSIFPDKGMYRRVTRNSNSLNSCCAIIGKVLYDMCVSTPNAADRHKVGVNCDKLILLMYHNDYVIDEVLINIEEKHSFIDKVNLNLFSGDTNTSDDSNVEISYRLAFDLYGTFLKNYDFSSLKSATTYSTLIGLQRLTEKDENKLLDLSKKVGSITVVSLLSIVEMVTGREYPDVTYSTTKLGEYAELLDDRDDLMDDLRSGVNTYSTAVMRRLGDTQATNP